MWMLSLLLWEQAGAAVPLHSMTEGVVPLLKWPSLMVMSTTSGRVAQSAGMRKFQDLPRLAAAVRGSAFGVPATGTVIPVVLGLVGPFMGGTPSATRQFEAQASKETCMRAGTFGTGAVVPVAAP